MELVLRQISRSRNYNLFKKKKTEMTFIKIFTNALIFDITVLIVHKIHYVNLVNFSLVSKQIRSVMFITSNRVLRQYSCYLNEKSDCYVCGIQICIVSFTRSFSSQN
jgi:hypothetical protein